MRMSLALKIAASVLGTMAVVACASAPPKAATPPVAAASDAAATQINPKLVGQGYKAVKYQGAYVYCRAEPVTGTQFQKKVCLSEAAIRDIEAKTQETVDGMTKPRSGPACFPGQNC
jgi:hypothetical protein